jgi:hypothetical protein
MQARLGKRAGDESVKEAMERADREERAPCSNDWRAPTGSNPSRLAAQRASARYRLSIEAELCAA